MSVAIKANPVPAKPGRLQKVIRQIYTNFMVRKLVKAVFTVWFVTTLTFFLIRLMPSNPVEIYMNQLITTYGLTASQARDQASALFAIDLNRPMILQYFDFLGDLLHGNLGYSLLSPGETVTEIIVAVIPWTLLSVGVGLLISFTLGILIGMFLAYKREAKIEPVISAIASMLSSIPSYIIGMLLLIYLGVYWHLVPINLMRGVRSSGIAIGFTPQFIGDILFHASLPIATYVLATIGIWILSMKSSTMSTLGEDYITVARARGLSEMRITTAYVGRNALLPLVTQFLINLGFIVGGAVLIENIFVYQGVGYRLFVSLVRRDYPLMQGIFLIITISVVVSNLLADFIYGFLDPRVRVSGGG